MDFSWFSLFAVTVERGCTQTAPSVWTIYSNLKYNAINIDEIIWESKPEEKKIAELRC